MNGLPGTRTRLVVAVAVPLAAAALGAVLLSVLASSKDFYIEGSLGTLPITVGVVVAAGAAAAVLTADRVSRARAEAWAAASARAAEERRRFLLRLDHELKNPLTAIRSGLANVDALVAGTPHDEARKVLAGVSGQTVRLASLVGDLRKLADLETRPIDAVPVDLGALLAEAVTAAGDLPGADRRSITLTVPRAPWPLPPVRGDHDLLFVAVHNLLANAVKFTQPGDTIEVRAVEDDHAVAVEVADTGAGIPAEESGLVWEELARGRAARGLPGTGMGLALVRAVAYRHGGTTTLRSRPGQGTVVVLRIPAVTGAETATRVPNLRQHRDTHGTPVA